MMRCIMPFQENKAGIPKLHKYELQEAPAQLLCRVHGQLTCIQSFYSGYRSPNTECSCIMVLLSLYLAFKQHETLLICGCHRAL